MLPIWFKIFIPLSLLIWAYYLWYVCFRFNPYYASGMPVLGLYALLALFPIVLLLTSLFIHKGQSIWWATLPFLFMAVAVYSFYQTNFASSVESHLSEQSTSVRQAELKLAYAEAEKQAPFSQVESEGLRLFITTVSAKATLYSAERNSDGMTWHYREPVVFGQIEPGNIIKVLPTTLGNMASKDLSGFVNAEGKSFTSIYQLTE